MSDYVAASLTIGGIILAYNAWKCQEKDIFLKNRVSKGFPPSEALQIAREIDSVIHSNFLTFPAYLVSIPGRELAYYMFRRTHKL